MAVDMFLKLDGIDGESRDKIHKDELDILSFSWGVSQTGIQIVDGQIVPGKPEPSEVHFVARVQKSTPKLFGASVRGQVIPTATLMCRRSGASAEFLKIVLGELVVASLQSAGTAGGDEGPVDQFSLNFAKIEVSYREQRPDGSFGEWISEPYARRQ